MTENVSSLRSVKVAIHEKSSLAPPGQSLAFSLGDEKGFEWIGAYDITADELLAGTDTAKTESKTAQAQMLILELLADGKRMLSAELEKAVKADPKVPDEIDTLEQEYDRVCEKHADLWEKVDEAYFNLPEDYDFDNYDEAAFIRSLSFLTNAEKDALIADYNRLVELDNQMYKLYDTIWGDTGCESGICPF